MLQYYSADWIFPVNSAPIQNGVVEVYQSGTISRILDKGHADLIHVKDIIKFEGALVPGFINTHCHLELSHMLGAVPEKTGIVDFVQNIIKNRDLDGEAILSAMDDADQQMFHNGIVAVGDISNQILSKPIKEKSRIFYHTFVEAMGFNPARAASIMQHAMQVKEGFAPLKASVVPHAPYSVSPELFKLIHDQAISDDNFISIHNQESPAEESFFIDKTGDFLKLYTFLGLDISFFEATGKTSVQSYLPYLKQLKILLVHNTFTNTDDINFVKQQDVEVYWCLCPGANLYIEDALPNVDLLINKGLKITLGTDSLASNHQLNILKEMQILQQHKQVPFNRLLQWATLNGAEFLGLSEHLGSIEPGKTPGLNLIQLSEDFIIKNDLVQKII